MKKNKKIIKEIVLIAMFSALLSGGKLALMVIPNIEIVTILIILYGFAFGPKISISATLIFCTLETFLFGFSTWTIAYFIHWPLLAIVSSVAGFFKLDKTFVYVIIGGVMTILFGVCSSAIDALISSQRANINFFYIFSIIYMRGIYFYLAQVFSNIIFIAVGFPVLSKLFQKAKSAYFEETKKFV